MQTHTLDLGWAQKRWSDPLTRTDVVRISPDLPQHFTNNYFRYNAFTGDGRYAVFCGCDRLEEGKGCGNKHLWARDLVSGEVRDLGLISDDPQTAIQYAVAPQSHRVNAIDWTDPDAAAILQVDIDSGERRRIVPSQPIRHINDASFSADERYVYTPQWGKHGHIKDAIDRQVSMLVIQQAMHSIDGLEQDRHEIVRIDLETGKVETVFDTSDWPIYAIVPNPARANLLMCFTASSADHPRASLLDVDTGEWRAIARDPDMEKDCVHEHWSADGGRIWAHQFLIAFNEEDVKDTWRRPHFHCVNRIDIDTGEVTWYASTADTAHSIHTYISPDEQFLVGDGYNFDCTTESPAVRQGYDALWEKIGREPLFFETEFNLPPGSGETIWKYELPDTTMWDSRAYQDNPGAFSKAVAENPAQTMRTQPVCKYRSLCRSHMLGYRLESNAQITPDGQWVMFQSSSDDDFFEVWAARIP